ncbi:MAG: hypothetical protein AAFV53_18250, partial [Myxococcota bacterium]
MRMIFLLIPSIALIGCDEDSENTEDYGADIVDLQNQINELTTLVENLQTENEALSAQLTNDVTALQEDIADTNTDLDTLETDVFAALAGVDIAALDASVTDIDGRLATVEGDYALNTDLVALDGRVAAIEADYLTSDDRTTLLNNFTVLDNRLTDVEDDYLNSDDVDVDAVNDFFSYVTVDTANDLVVYTGANVVIQNGDGSTDTENGVGNLVVGYLGDSAGGDGSHNIVIGDNHTWNSYANLITGEGNAAEAPYAVLSGGQGNTGSTDYAAVVDGYATSTELADAQTAINTSIASVQADLDIAETDIDTLEATALSSTNFDAVNDFFSYVATDTTNNLVVYTGANVVIQNGDGSTDTENGVGNLVVGYLGTGSGDGSHNIVIGDDHTWNSYANLITGEGNAAEAPYAVLIGGQANTGSTDYAAVVDGYVTTADLTASETATSAAIAAVVADLDVVEADYLTSTSIDVDANNDFFSYVTTDTTNNLVVYTGANVVIQNGAGST